MYKLVRKRSVLVNGEGVSCYTRLKAGDQVVLYADLQKNNIKREKTDLPSQNKNPMEKFMIFSDDSVLVLNKPYGISVQGGIKQNLHIDGLMSSFDKSIGLVHRLDKDTTGILLMGKGRICRNALAAAFRDKLVEKVYWGLVYPAPKKREGNITDNLGGQFSLTRYKVMEESRGFSWVEFYPVTGRYHQIRKHCFNNGFPIVGDSKYGGNRSTLKSRKLHLHACKIIFPHPKNKCLYAAQAPLPGHMLDSWKLLSFCSPDIDSPSIMKLDG